MWGVGGGEVSNCSRSWVATRVSLEMERQNYVTVFGEEIG